MQKQMVAMLFLLTLGACANPKVIVQKINPPSEWLECKDEPAAPVEVTPDSTVRYMMDLRAAWFDCHDKLTRVKDWAG